MVQLLTQCRFAISLARCEVLFIFWIGRIVQRNHLCKQDKGSGLCKNLTSILVLLNCIDKEHPCLVWAEAPQSLCLNSFLYHGCNLEKSLNFENWWGGYVQRSREASPSRVEIPMQKLTQFIITTELSLVQKRSWYNSRTRGSFTAYVATAWDARSTCHTCFGSIFSRLGWG